MADLPRDESVEVVVIDGAGTNEQVVNSDGSTLHRIIDGTGGGYQAKVDSQNRLVVVANPSLTNIPIQLQYYNTASTPLAANQWQDIFTYTVPSTYNLSIVQFQVVSGQAGDDARIVQRTVFGSLNTNTGTYTAGTSESTPAFSAELYVRVTTTIGNVNNDTLTITYTNQDGTTGRTATAALPKNSPVGTNIQVTLQSPDYGVMAVTNVTRTVTQAGVVSLDGTTAIVYETAGTANIEQESVFGQNTAVLPFSSSVVMQYNTSVGGAKFRRITAMSNLLPL